MVLELHIWGPGFGLPSIDAQCLAAVAYLQLAIGPPKSKRGGVYQEIHSDADGRRHAADDDHEDDDVTVEWVLVAEIDTGMVPTGKLLSLA